MCANENCMNMYNAVLIVHYVQCHSNNLGFVFYFVLLLKILLSLGCKVKGV